MQGKGSIASVPGSEELVYKSYPKHYIYLQSLKNSLQSIKNSVSLVKQTGAKINKWNNIKLRCLHCKRNDRQDIPYRRKIFA